MNDRIIADISDFIFISDEPEKCDVIFLPGSCQPEAPEYAARLYNEGFADIIIPSGGVSVKHNKFQGVSNKADIYNGDYKTDCEFFTDVLVKKRCSLRPYYRRGQIRTYERQRFFVKEAA